MDNSINNQLEKELLEKLTQAELITLIIELQEREGELLNRYEKLDEDYKLLLQKVSTNDSNSIVKGEEF